MSENSAPTSVPKDFREVLLRELEERQRRRPNYSRRAFARDLGMNHTTLHDVLSGRYGISVQTARQVAARLEFEPTRMELFVDLVKSKHARSKIERQGALDRLRKTYGASLEPEPLSDSELEITKNWYYAAILELVTIKKGAVSVDYLAPILNLTTQVVGEALERLCQLAVLRLENGRYIRSKNYTFGERKTPTPAIRSFHKQLISKASDAIEQPIEERKHLSFVFSFDSNQTEKARQRLTEMQRAFYEEFQTEEKPDSVYALCMQFFAVAKPS